MVLEGLILNQQEFGAIWNELVLLDKFLRLSFPWAIFAWMEFLHGIFIIAPNVVTMLIALRHPTIKTVV